MGVAGNARKPLFCLRKTDFCIYELSNPSESNGPFEAVEDLMKVKGIGRKVLEDNKDNILIKEQKGSSEETGD